MEESVKDMAGSCFGCPNWPGRRDEVCDEGREWEPISKKNNPPCYEHVSSVLGYSPRDEE